MNKICPRCKAHLKKSYGFGMDYDKLVCECGFQMELNETTFPPMTKEEKFNKVCECLEEIGFERKQITD